MTAPRLTGDALIARKKKLRELCATHDITPRRISSLLYAAEHERGHYKRKLHDPHATSDWLTERDLLRFEDDLADDEKDERRASAAINVARAREAIVTDWKEALGLLQEALKLETNLDHKVYRITEAGRALVRAFQVEGFTGDEIRYQL
jgi:hypothetical protein